ncbi:hypothetical protein SISNIDRAFT_488606 [Sistotremastrum niveocremeum HHB9708]|uniref:Uncharacterized protein n=1 Tax=Sistotremastrum niveocremeum HHB9708 TaxID=1314777 RepID=A0A164QY13_9AGAM|nr:hypothetical protein SISNIDRAFT_488606 [Sistotremastrum niveocremeum HHB9708]
MKLILTGATGVAGLAILRAATHDPQITKITVLSRRPLPPHAAEFSKSKAEVIIHQNFTSYPSELVGKLKDHDAVIWALGASQIGMKEEDYIKMTHDFPMAAVSAFHEAGLGSPEKPFRFVHISGEGADREEKGWALFSKIKGRTEKDLVEYASTRPSLIAQNLRPGYFAPQDWGDIAATRGRLFGLADKLVLRWYTALSTNLAVRVEDLGKFAVDVAKGEHGNDDLYRNVQMRGVATGRLSTTSGTNTEL